MFITGVTLGDDIEHGGDFDPFQVETPFEFCFAMCAFNARRHNVDIAGEWAYRRNQEQEKVEKQKLELEKSLSQAKADIEKFKSEQKNSNDLIIGSKRDSELTRS